MKKLLLVALVCAGVGSVALGQTGRIALASHGGSVGALMTQEKTEDNFGNPATFKADSIQYLSDSTVLLYGRWDYVRRPETTCIERLPKKMSQAEAAEYFQNRNNVFDVYWEWEYGSKEKLVGFDKQKKSMPSRPAPTKPTKRTQAFPKRPFQYSYWRGLSAVVALGTVGWLLGKKRPA